MIRPSKNRATAWTTKLTSQADDRTAPSSDHQLVHKSAQARRLFRAAKAVGRLSQFSRAPRRSRGRREWDCPLCRGLTAEVRHVARLADLPPLSLRHERQRRGNGLVAVWRARGCCGGLRHRNASNASYRSNSYYSPPQGSLKGQRKGVPQRYHRFHRSSEHVWQGRSRAR